MVRDVDAEDYTEHHADGVLEFRFEPRNGIPFPAFAAASGDFPELRVEAEWEHDGVLGRAVLENGRVVQETAARPGPAAVDISVAEDGRLVLAMVCRKSGDALIGYAASSERPSAPRRKACIASRTWSGATRATATCWSACTA